MSISANEIKKVRSLSEKKFRDRFGLASACFTIAEVDGRVRVVTKGLGHGYGLSQWGANELAKDGKDCVEILKYYFPNISLFSGIFHINVI